MNKLKWVILLVFLGICGTVSSQNLSAIDENNGFQNYKFGMHMDEFQNCDFRTVEDGGAERCLIRRMHRIGDIEAQSVALFFVDSELSKIKVNFEAFDYSQLKNAITSAFGSYTESKRPQNDLGLHSKKYDVKYIWEADNIKLLCEYSPPVLGSDTLFLEYSLNDYDDLQDKYRSKKYTPSDF